MFVINGKDQQQSVANYSDSVSIAIPVGRDDSIETNQPVNGNSSAYETRAFGYSPDTSGMPAWERAAWRRIERIRMGRLSINVVDDLGTPIPNASVHVSMKRQRFHFGTAVNARFLFADTLESPDKVQYRNAVLKYFNTATLEGAMKWKSWRHPQARRRATLAVHWLRANNIDVRGHNLVWPSWKHSPVGIETLPIDTLKSIINRHIEQIVHHFDGDVYDWDVVNEPYTNHDLIDLLGPNILAKWFKTAAIYAPDVRLSLNDNHILAAGGRTHSAHQNALLRTIIDLQSAGAPISGIGIQSHFRPDTVCPPESLLVILDRYGQSGLPITITEYDYNVDDETEAARYMHQFLTTVFSHPSVDGFLMWGFWDGRHWRNNAPLFRRDWSLKPSGREWVDLVFGKWWTDNSGMTDTEGTYTTTGFFGTYDVSADLNGKTAKVEIEWNESDRSVTLRLATS